jgi:hypothetical protein
MPSSVGEASESGAEDCTDWVCAPRISENKTKKNIIRFFIISDFDLQYIHNTSFLIYLPENRYEYQRVQRIWKGIK